MFDASTLPNDVEALKELFLKTYSQTQNILKEKDFEIERLSELVRFFKRREFGSKSEVIPTEQMGFFNEIEEAMAEVLKEASSESQVVEGYDRKKPGRKRLPQNLPRERRVIDLAESEKICGCCGELMCQIGEDVSETVELIPAQMKVIETARLKYSCQNKNCDEPIKTAPAPLVAIPKSMASPSLLAYLAVNKFCDHLPFYRQSGILERFGLEISRATMAGWMVRIAELMMPLLNLLTERLLSGGYINMDETRLQVISEQPGKGKTKRYMWVYGSADGPDKIIIFEYASTRRAEVATKLLSDFKGYLQVDGYGGYNEVTDREDIIRLGCMAHARRRFHRAWLAVKKAEGLAAHGLRQITLLYNIERAIKDKSTQARYEVRQQKSKPILDAMKLWLQENLDKVPPKSPLGEALRYSAGEWEHLERYVEDGRLMIDNNFIENKIRPFALGRKNWLFSDSVDGAKASATIYSILQTAQANGLEPWSYLTHVLAEIPKAKTVDDFENLLPLAKFSISCQPAVN